MESNPSAWQGSAGDRGWLNKSILFYTTILARTKAKDLLLYSHFYIAKRKEMLTIIMPFVIIQEQIKYY